MWVLLRLQLKVLANVAMGTRSCHVVWIKCLRRVRFTVALNVIMHHSTRYLFIISVSFSGPNHSYCVWSGHFLSEQQNSFTSQFQTTPLFFTSGTMGLHVPLCPDFYWMQCVIMMHLSSYYLLFPMYWFWDTIRNVITLYDQKYVNIWRHSHRMGVCPKLLPQ